MKIFLDSWFLNFSGRKNVRALFCAEIISGTLRHAKSALAIFQIKLTAHCALLASRAQCAVNKG
jgi:hypothetical protein